MIYGESAEITGFPESGPQLRLQGLMREAWGAFVRDPMRGLSKAGWPVYNPRGFFWRLFFFFFFFFF
jgi:hypothetical protein